MVRSEAGFARFAQLGRDDTISETAIAAP